MAFAIKQCFHTRKKQTIKLLLIKSNDLNKKKQLLKEKQFFNSKIILGANHSNKNIDEKSIPKRAIPSLLTI